jgi:hypothetical protein
MPLRCYGYGHKRKSRKCSARNRYGTRQPHCKTGQRLSLPWLNDADAEPSATLKPDDVLAEVADVLAETATIVTALAVAEDDAADVAAPCVVSGTP